MNINQTETTFFWDHGLEMILIIKEEDLNKVEDEVFLNNGWKLNIMLEGRKLECRICKQRSQIKKNFDAVKEHSVRTGRKEVGGEETEAMVRKKERMRPMRWKKGRSPKLKTWVSKGEEEKETEKKRDQDRGEGERNN